MKLSILLLLLIVIFQSQSTLFVCNPQLGRNLGLQKSWFNAERANAQWNLQNLGNSNAYKQARVDPNIILSDVYSIRVGQPPVTQNIRKQTPAPSQVTFQSTNGLKRSFLGTENTGNVNLNITGGSRVDENTNVGGGGSGAINGGTGVVSGGYSATSQQTTINSNSGVQNNNQRPIPDTYYWNSKTQVADGAELNRIIQKQIDEGRKPYKPLYQNQNQNQNNVIYYYTDTPASNNVKSTPTQLKTYENWNHTIGNQLQKKASGAGAQLLKDMRQSTQKARRDTDNFKPDSTQYGFQFLKQYAPGSVTSMQQLYYVNGMGFTQQKFQQSAKNAGLNFDPGSAALLKTAMYGNRDVFLNNLPTTKINMGNTVINPGAVTDLTTGSSSSAPYLSDKAQEDFELMSYEEQEEGLFEVVDQFDFDQYEDYGSYDEEGEEYSDEDYQQQQEEVDGEYLQEDSAEESDDSEQQYVEDDQNWQQDNAQQDVQVDDQEYQEQQEWSQEEQYQQNDGEQQLQNDDQVWSQESQQQQ